MNNSEYDFLSSDAEKVKEKALDWLDNQVDKFETTLNRDRRNKEALPML